MTNSQIEDALALVVVLTGLAIALVFIPWWVMLGIIVLAFGWASF